MDTQQISNEAFKIVESMKSNISTLAKQLLDIQNKFGELHQELSRATASESAALDKIHELQATPLEIWVAYKHSFRAQNAATKLFTSESDAYAYTYLPENKLFQWEVYPLPVN